MMTLQELADFTGGRIDPKDAGIEIGGVASAGDAAPGDVTFLGNKKYLPALRGTRASAAFVVEDFTEEVPCALIRVENPSVAFAKFVDRIAPAPPVFEPGVHASAVVDAPAAVGDGVHIGPNVSVGKNVTIGENTIIEANCVIAEGCRIGNGCHLFPLVSLRERSVLGHRVAIHNGTVIGSDGYGYEFVGGKHVKIPQVGIVQIDNDVEIGANCTIDRARFGRTWIGEGTKIDNLVHLAHNVVVGKHSLIIAQVGISGSTRLGNYVILAGQVGVAGHIEIGDGVQVGAQSGIKDSLKPGTRWFGSPAVPAREAHVSSVWNKRLPQLAARIKELEKKIL